MKRVVADNFNAASFARHRYNRFGEYLRMRHGTKIAKLSLDAGFTCPNRDGTKGVGGCVFCDGAGGHTFVDRERLDIGEQLARGKLVVGSKYKTDRFLAYFQSFTNTYAPFDRLVEIFSAVLADPQIVGIAIGTRADCLDDRILDWLDEKGRDKEVWIELGIQSTHQRTLDIINRCERSGEVLAAVRRIVARDHLLVCGHFVIGLPGEDREMAVSSVRAVSALGIDAIKLHQLQILRGLAAERMLEAGVITPLAIGEYVATVADIIESIPREMIVERVNAYLPGRASLVAPRWSVAKFEPARLVTAELLRRGSGQGFRTVRSGV